MRMRSLWLVASVLTLSAAAQAQDFAYITNNGALTIKKYTGSGGNVIIPDRLPDTNGLPVTSIGDWAFEFSTGMTNVTIPCSVTSIGPYAFAYCSGLTGAYFQGNAPSADLTVFYFAYYGTTVYYLPGTTGWESLFGGQFTAPWSPQVPFSFTATNCTISITAYTGPDGDVVIPGTIAGLPVTRIADWGLAFLSSITSVTIPDTVTDIGNAALASCTSLTGITVDTNNSCYSTTEGVLFDKSQTILIRYPGGKIGSCVISNSVTSIKDSAFYGSEGLTSVTVPDSVTNLGDAAFNWCRNLTSVTIGNGVATIGNDTFGWCTSLTNITIPNSVTSIENWAFNTCSSLAGITIPDSVRSIGDWAFSECTSLTGIAIGNSVTNIGTEAFESCHGLTNVTIPQSVTGIGGLAFGTCSSLIAISVDSSNPAYSSIEGVLFNGNQTVLIQYPASKVGSGYTIPGTVTRIGNWTFLGCGSLANVTIPNSVTNIGDQAFAVCPSLASVTIPSSVISMGSSVFALCWNLKGVYYRGDAPLHSDTVFSRFSTAIVYYLPGASDWGPTFAEAPTALWQPQMLTSDASFGVHTNQFGFTIAWSSGMATVVEATTDLASPTWQPLQTNTLTADTLYFSEPDWTNYARRFYRVR